MPENLKMDSLAKHTPGPWEFKLLKCPGEEVRGFSIRADGKTPNLCGAGVYEDKCLTVSPSFRGLDWTQDYYTPEEVEANARLIAEAPRLLWVLKAILQDLPVKHDWLDPTVEREARAVIKEI